MRTLFIAAMIITAVMTATGLLRLKAYYTTPHTGPQVPVVLTIVPGGSLRQISAQLNESGVIGSSRMFELLARSTGGSRVLQSGTYEFTEALSPVEVFDRLRRGLIRLQPFTVPEGRTLFETARIIAGAGLSEEEELLAKMTDPDFAGSLGLDADSLEGFLFPDTYFFAVDASAEDVLTKMVGRYRQVFAEEMQLIDEPPALNEYEIVTLASLVEAETGQTHERPLIAGVFLRRLEKGMRLECDPTVAYGQLLLDPSFNERLRRRHLTEHTPHNTYRNHGLPPTPICSPGRHAIRAVLQPAATDYLFFVSRNDGSHVFSRTLREHNRAVEAYQKKRGGR
jgi:UPF0755 protein